MGYIRGILVTSPPCFPQRQLVASTCASQRQAVFQRLAFCDLGHAGCCRSGARRLCDELDNTTGLLDLALGVLGEVAGADDEGNLRDATLAEDLAVAEGQEVEDGGGLGGLVGQVLLALLGGDEGPELLDDVSVWFQALEIFAKALRSHSAASKTYLVEVDDGLPELVLELVEVPHTNLTEVTRVVLVDVGTVVVLTTGHTATTGRLAVLADTTFTGRDMATVLAGLGETGRHCGGIWRLSSWVRSRR